MSSNLLTLAGGKRLMTRYRSDGDLKVIDDRPSSKKIVSSDTTRVRFGLLISQANIHAKKLAIERLALGMSLLGRRVIQANISRQ